MGSDLEKVFSANEKLSKQQRAFRKNIESVTQLSRELDILEAKIYEYKAEYLKVVAPLEKEYFELIKSRILTLAEALGSLKLSKRIERDLLMVMEHECKQYHHYHDDPEVKAVYNQYFISDEVAWASDEEMIDEENKANYDQDGKGFDFREEPFVNETKKGKAKRKAKEEQRVELRLRSIKSIFKDLIKVFHPDKELDEDKKKEKDELSKKITEAYRKNDLFTLLQFELQLLAQNSDRLEGLEDDKLKIYNELLVEQKENLESRLRSMKRQNVTIYKGMCAQNSNKDKFLKKVKGEMKESNKNLKGQIAFLKVSKEYLKEFIVVYLYELDMFRPEDEFKRK